MARNATAAIVCAGTGPANPGLPITPPAVAVRPGMGARYHRCMPLPPPPTQRPNNPVTRKADKKADNELLFKGVLCALIGFAVLATPYFIQSPGVQDIVAKASLVGWFALVLGCAFIGVVVRRRLAASGKA